MPLLFSPTEGRLRTGWRLLGHLALLVLLYVAVAIFLEPLQVLLSLGESFSALFLFDAIAASIAITASVFLARRRFDKRSFASLGLVRNRRAACDLLAGIGIAGLIIAAIYIAEAAFGWLRFEAFTWHRESLIPIDLLVYSERKGERG